VIHAFLANDVPHPRHAFTHLGHFSPHLSESIFHYCNLVLQRLDSPRLALSRGDGDGGGGDCSVALEDRNGTSSR